MDMEDELTAQRDAAIAVTKELQKQLQSLRAEIEAKFERRALTAERLRLHAEAELRRVRDERAWETQMHNRVLYLALFAGMLGALVGWCIGLQVLLMFGQPLVGFLLILPTTLLGGLVGLAIAKTKAQLESRQRDARKRRIEQHTEVERAVYSALSDDATPLDAFTGVDGTHMTGDDLRTVNRNAATALTDDDGVDDSVVPQQQRSAAMSVLSTVGGFAWTTLCVSKDIAVNMYYAKEPMAGALDVQRSNSNSSNSSNDKEGSNDGANRKKQR